MKKKRIFNLLSLPLALMVTIGFTACSGGNIKSVEKIVQTAVKNAQSIKNYDFNMSIDYKMSISDQSMNGDVITNCSVFTDPLKMKMDMQMDANEISQKIQVYVEQEGSNINTYTDVNNSWQKTTVPVGSDKNSNQYNIKENIALYLENAKSFKEVGIEQVNGKETIKVEGVISGDSLQKVMDGSGMFNNLSSLGLNDMNLSDLYKNLGNLPVVVWIDKETLYAVKYEMDMTVLMSSIFTNMKNLSSDETSSAEVNVDKYITTVVLSNFNQAKDFEIPAEAKR